MLKKITLGAILTVSSALVNAGIVSFDINQSFTQGVGLSDLSDTSVSLGGAGSFTVDPGTSNNYFDFVFSGTGAFSVTSTQIDDYFFAETYLAGETLGLGNFGVLPVIADEWVTILVNNAVAETWTATHDGYLGFLSDNGLYGWIEYNYERNSTTQQSTMSFLSGAYNDVTGESITIPSENGTVDVSAPTSIALFGLGLLGLGLSRRKKLTK